MKRFVTMIITLVTFAACHNTENANEKIKECLEDEYGSENVDEHFDDFEITCEDGEEECDTCVDCVMEAECADILEGDCSADCSQSVNSEFTGNI